MARTLDPEKVLLAGAQLIKLLPHVIWHGAVLRPLHEEHGDARMREMAAHPRIAQVIPRGNAVDGDEGIDERADARLENVHPAGVGAVGDDELHLRGDRVAHVHHRAAAHGEAVQNDADILAVGLYEEIQPLEAVRALVYVIAHVRAAALARGGIVAGEHVYPAAQVVFIIHPARVQMVGAEAVHDEGDAPGGLVAGLVVEALQPVAAVGIDGIARAGCLPHARGGGVAVVVVVRGVSLFVEFCDEPWIAAEEIPVYLAQGDGGSRADRGGSAEYYRMLYSCFLFHALFSSLSLPRRWSRTGCTAPR